MSCHKRDVEIKAAKPVKEPMGSKITSFPLIIVSSLMLSYFWTFLIMDPTIPVNQFKSLDEAFTHGAQEPFIVRNPKEFQNLTMEKATERIKEMNGLVFGYTEESEVVRNMICADLIRDWHVGNLTMTVFDSPLHIFDLPPVLSKHHSPGDVDASELVVELGQTIILSRQNSYTALHMDPLNYGGGWMYIWSGQKDWHFLDPQFADILYDPENHWLDDLSPSEFVSDLKELWNDGPIPKKSTFRSAKARPGDFIYFPPAWMHRVKTFDKTMGIGGYIRPRQTLDRLSEIEEFFNESGVMHYWD